MLPIVVLSVLYINYINTKHSHTHTHVPVYKRKKNRQTIKVYISQFIHFYRFLELDAYFEVNKMSFINFSVFTLLYV